MFNLKVLVLPVITALHRVRTTTLAPTATPDLPRDVPNVPNGAWLALQHPAAAPGGTLLPDGRHGMAAGDYAATISPSHDPEGTGAGVPRKGVRGEKAQSSAFG